MRICPNNEAYGIGNQIYIRENDLYNDEKKYLTKANITRQTIKEMS